MGMAPADWSEILASRPLFLARAFAESHLRELGFWGARLSLVERMSAVDRGLRAVQKFVCGMANHINGLECTSDYNPAAVRSILRQANQLAEAS
jgi:hypothetical protein